MKTEHIISEILKEASSDVPKIDHFVFQDFKKLQNENSEYIVSTLVNKYRKPQEKILEMIAKERIKDQKFRPNFDHGHKQPWLGM